MRPVGQGDVELGAKHLQVRLRTMPTSHEIDATLGIDVFGRFKVTLGDSMVEQFPTERARALLLLLAVEPDLKQERAKLASLLWSERDSATARRNLRRCLGRLKSVIGDTHIVATRQHIELTATDSNYNRFQALVSSDDPDDWQEAAELCDGEFVAGFEVKNSNLFDDWLSDRRMLLHQKRVGLLHKLFGTAAEDPHLRLTYAQQLAAVEPYDDVAHRQIMSAYAEIGNVSAALAHYEQFATTLREELGTEPEASTRDLHTTLVATLASRPATLYNVPAQVTPFVGRANDRDAIVRQLQDANCRMLTVLGVGGIGKTRLALEVVAQLRSDQFADGVYFVPLVTATSALDVLATLLRVLAVPAQGDDLEVQLLDYLQDKNLLLVLDNLEQLAGEMRFLARLLQHAPDVKILATSRDVVGISAEYRYPISGLTDLQESTSLLWGAIRRIVPDFDLTVDNLSIGARICEQLHGVPLALELAATWINTLDLDSIREEIEHAYEFLESPLLDTPDRHRSLHAIFDHSWNLLTPKQQTILAKLSVFRGGFDMRVARPVLGAGIHDLRRLVEQSLLIKQEQNRYSLHELVRQFATEKLASQDEATIRQAHASYYLALPADNRDRLFGEAGRSASELIAADLANIKVAWRWAIDNGAFEQIAACAPSMTHFFRLTGRLAEGDRLYVDAIDRLGSQMDDHLLAQLHVGCAHFRMWQSRHVESISSAENALVAATRSEDSRLIAESHLAKARSNRAMGNIIMALPIFQQAIAACDVAPDDTHDIRAEIVGNLGLISSYGIDPVAGYELSNTAASEARQSGNKMIEAFALACASFSSSRLYKLAESYSGAHKAIALAQSLGNPIFEAAALATLSRSQAWMGLHEQAVTSTQRAHQVYLSIGDNWGEIFALTGYCNVYFEMREFDKVIHFADIAIALGKAKGIVLHRAYAMYWKGMALLELGQLEAAFVIFDSLRQMRVTMGLPRQFAHNYVFGLGAVALARGETEAARALISAEVDHFLRFVHDPIHLVRHTLIGYRILSAVNDSRAEQLLEVAYKHIMHTADVIENPDYRSSYFEKSWLNRALLERYQALQPASQPVS